ncbi:hypothetical protein F5148DRAFT_1153458 [Russula earlei]|uniref:Uncharacterized protein n=1 Tax=Russula earlei TaxID=71964 RepID=A0ACC0TU86_9AGAM|nr:hypothetical protein F5148DRAFT_1153458 [Russula earlei]
MLVGEAEAKVAGTDEVAMMVDVGDAGTVEAGGAGELKTAAVNEVTGMVDEVGTAGVMGVGQHEGDDGRCRDNGRSWCGRGVDVIVFVFIFIARTEFAFPLNVTRTLREYLDYCVEHFSEIDKVPLLFICAPGAKMLGDHPAVVWVESKPE